MTATEPGTRLERAEPGPKAGRRPLVKVCGITRPEDAELACELGADLLGVNLWPHSPRFVARAAAREIAAVARGRATLVGVFVNAPRAAVQEALDQIGLDLAQLHGDEPPEVAVSLGERAVQVFRVTDRFDPETVTRFPRAWGFLFDVHHPDYGGTGRGWRYELIRDLPTSRPVLVAGGVRPETVREVLARARPDGVDVCSGVESRPGVKDPVKLRRLFEEVCSGAQTSLA